MNLLYNNWGRSHCGADESMWEKGKIMNVSVYERESEWKDWQ